MWWDIVYVFWLNKTKRRRKIYLLFQSPCIALINFFLCSELGEERAVAVAVGSGSFVAWAANHYSSRREGVRKQPMEGVAFSWKKIIWNALASYNLYIYIIIIIIIIRLGMDITTSPSLSIGDKQAAIFGNWRWEQKENQLFARQTTTKSWCFYSQDKINFF